MPRQMDQLEHTKRSAVVKRSIVIDSHKTSVSLENEFWFALREIAKKICRHQYSRGTHRRQSG